MTVRAARSEDLDRIVQIAWLAGRRFATEADPRIAARADDPPPELHALSDLIRSRRLLVAVDPIAAPKRGPVGFLLLDIIDGHGHVEEVSVDPDAGGRGHGTALLAAADAWCRRTGRGTLTLTTFRDVAWNAPWYAHLGFEVVRSAARGPELASRMAHEAALGLDPGLRVAMARAVHGVAPTEV